MTRSDKAALEEELNLQLEQHRDALSKSKIDAAELASQLETEREQMHQAQEMHANNIDTLSERWTLERQEMTMDIDELRKSNEQLEAHVQDLMAMRNEEANRHDQELGDVVGEFEDKEMELARAHEELRNFEDLLQARDARISELLDKIDELEMARREADAVHDEVVNSVKSVNHPPYLLVLCPILH
jgi:septal ring factor EnvC (AmiA/AmiB activator)